MQVSVYLDEDLLQQVEKKAKFFHKSRSQIIQETLQNTFGSQKVKSLFDEVFGVLSPQEGEALLGEIRQYRKNSQRFQ